MSAPLSGDIDKDTHFAAGGVYNLRKNGESPGCVKQIKTREKVNVCLCMGDCNNQ